MLTYEQLKEKCTCWKGYKRKPGTKPCEEGSCVKEEKDAKGHGSEKHHALAFGRMNPITTGHEAVVNKLHSVAKEHGATHSLVVSHSQDAKKNPLSAEQKVKHAKRAFPGTNVTAASKEHPTILHHAAEAHKAGAQHLHVVAGSDRHEEMHKLLHKYNGQHSAHGHYNFKSITVHSSGERDPDSEGTTGISASKMREHAASGNKAEFHKGAPSKMSAKHKEEMYHDVRKGMNIKEETTPYWKKASWNKKMSALAKQERLAREKKEAEKKPVKEETVDQQADRKNQMKRFHDQVAALVKQINKKPESAVNEGTIQPDGTDKIDTQTSAPTASTSKDTTMGKKVKGFKFFNGKNEPNTTVHEDKTVNVDKVNSAGQEPHEEKFETVAQKAMKIVAKKKQMQEEAEVERQIQEVLSKDASAADWIHDFVHSTNPKFNNKSKEKRKQMALAAYYAKQRNEEVELAEKNWIAGAIKKPGAETAAAKRAGMSTHEYMEKHKNDPGKAGKRARLGLTLSKLAKEEVEIDENHAPVAPTIDRKYIKGTPEWKAHKEKSKPINGHPTNNVKEEAEQIDEKSAQARRNKTWKNLMAASKGAKINKDVGLTPDLTGHKNKQQMNKAIGRAASRGELPESATGNPGGGYHGAQPTADEKYEQMHAHVKNLTDGDDKMVKHYLDSGYGAKLAGKEEDHDYIKSDFDKFMKYYRPKTYDTKEPETKKSTVKKEETMKSYKDFVQSIQEIKMADLPSRKVQGKSYGANYEDPEGAFETKDDMKKADKKAAGRKTGQRVGSYKRRQPKAAC